ncbi:SGNH/GDSL hydrolase family protein [Pseudomonas sp. App30]|uniref:SGNH/GDSL hydrolase family protein n=1 Tax=Pseudomonas sp. App30 TaxID=3068990 RepID=UPI003A7FC416
MDDTPNEQRKPRLPRRDLVLIPMLVGVTLAVLLGAGEGLARYFYPAQQLDSCQIPDDIMGTRFKPDCTSSTKAPEGPWVTNHYNDCGFRSQGSCASKPAGALRIVAFGSSLTQGYLVPYEQSYPVRVGASLATSCHRAIDVQDVASIGYNWSRAKLDFDEAVKLAPDLLITSIVPFDLERDPADFEASSAPAAPAPEPPLLNRLYVAIKEQARSAYVAQYFYFKNAEAFTDLYLHYGEKANFLRTPFTPFWQSRLDTYEKLLADMADQARAAHVPLVLVYVPQRAQVAMISGTRTPPGVDPWAFSRAIGDIARRHGIVYVNTSDEFSHLKNAADLYYPVDGHPSGAGHAVIADAVVQRLVNLPDDRFASCATGAATAALQPRTTP